MELTELYQKIGEATIKKLGDSFDPSKDEITGEIASSLIEKAEKLLTEEQAVSEKAIRNKIMGRTLTDMDNKIFKILENDPSLNFSSDVLKEIFAEEGKTTDKFYRAFKAQTAALESKLAESKNGNTEKVNEATQKELERRMKLIQEKEAAIEALKNEIETGKIERHKSAVDSRISGFLAGRRFNAPNENVKDLMLKDVYAKAHQLAEFQLDGENVIPLQKETGQPIYDPKSSKPLAFQEFIEGIAEPYLAKREESGQNITLSGKALAGEIGKRLDAKENPIAKAVRATIDQNLAG